MVVVLSGPGRESEFIRETTLRSLNRGSLRSREYIDMTSANTSHVPSHPNLGERREAKEASRIQKRRKRNVHYSIGIVDESLCGLSGHLTRSQDNL